MLTYIAAVATAVTLAFASVQAPSNVDDSAPTPGEGGGVMNLSPVAPPLEQARIEDALMKGSAILGGAPYRLTISDQRALHRALMKSVRFIDSLG